MNDSAIKIIENNDETLEFPLRLSKLCLLNIRDDNTFICPLSIEAALNALLQSNVILNKNLSFYFYNYFILDEESIKTLPENFNEKTIEKFNTEFQIHIFNDIEQKKMIINELLKDFSQRVQISIISSQKFLGQILIEPMTLISCCSFIFRPFQIEYWEQLWSLKFQTNPHLSIETEFFFTKGFFHVAFHKTFHKIEIPGEILNGIQMKLIILLPQCSSDLVHLYANIKEYLSLPYTCAYIGVCLPKISMDIDMNILESLKMFNPQSFTDQIHLSGARFIGHFSLDMTSNNTTKSFSSCSHSIDLSPVTPWVFFANRPFLFLITYGDIYILIGQMLGPKYRQETKKFK